MSSRPSTTEVLYTIVSHGRWLFSEFWSYSFEYPDFHGRSKEQEKREFSTSIDLIVDILMKGEKYSLLYMSIVVPSTKNFSGKVEVPGLRLYQCTFRIQGFCVAYRQSGESNCFCFDMVKICCSRWCRGSRDRNRGQMLITLRLLAFLSVHPHIGFSHPI